MPFVTFAPAIVLAASFGGWWPGAVSTVLTALAVLFVVWAPNALHEDSRRWGALAVFVVLGAAVSGLLESLHRSRHRALVAADTAERALARERSARAELQETIAALRTSEEQFRQAQKMEAIGRVAGGVAHDFNNLLTVIVGCAEFLLMQLKEGDPARHDAEEIRRAADRATSLTSQLLAFGRKQILRPEVVDLGAVVDDTRRMLVRVIGENIAIDASVEDGLWPVLADRGQLEQILMNLAVNARDAMENGGSATIRATNVTLDERGAGAVGLPGPGRYVALSLSDTGCGMTEEVRSRAVEPFFTTKDVGKGTGLGLSTVYGIARQSGGAVSIRSAPGAGTEVTIFLPDAGDTTTKVSTTGAADAPADGLETVLLAEDDSAVRWLVRTALEMRGYRVLEAESGNAAIALADGFAERIDILVTDVVMPGLGGRELAERLVTARPDMAVLFITGYTDDEVLRNGVAIDPSGLLLKPFTPDILARRVRDRLDARRGADSGRL